MGQQKPIFVFDLHNVIFKPSYHQIYTIIMDLPRKYNLLFHLLNPLFLVYMFSLIIRMGLGQGFLDRLALRYTWLNRYKEFLITVIDAQIPIDSTYELLKQLHAQEYRLFLLSNMGEINFNKLRQRYPQLFALFNGAHFFGPATNWQQKPEPAAFITFLQRFQLKASDLLFIDNSKRNIRGAQQVGIEGIHYQSHNQLQDALQHKQLI